MEQNIIALIHAAPTNGIEPYGNVLFTNEIFFFHC